MLSVLSVKCDFSSERDRYLKKRTEKLKINLIKKRIDITDEK
jgi:hypothetical protein